MTLYYKKILVVAFAITLCLLTQVDVYAQKQPVSMATPLIGDSVKAGKTLALQDTIFYNVSLNPYIAQTNGIDNIVSLKADEFWENKLPPDTFHVVVRINVTYTTTSNTNSSRLDTLTIFYSKNNPYSNKAVKLYRNFRSVNVEILDVAITGATASLVRPLLRMDNLMVVDRNFTTNCNAITSISHSDATVSADGELLVSWPAVNFIPAYDLEWTFIDEAALDSGNYNTGGNLDPLLIFKNNSTRVTVNGSSYKIPLLYDGDGTVFFRVRTIQNAPDGEVIAGQWSTESGSGGLGEYVYTGHQRNLNWQATTTYAEEGKRKSVVQYYDGSLKGRQTVTKDNTTQTTVVAETLYDKQGRPVIQVLPSPTLSNLIAYTPLFNQKGDVTPEEYDKSLYDSLINPAEYCGTGAPLMGVANGSSQYYSPSNPLLSVPQPDYHQFVPDAAKYPFTETRYTRDNTGRIDRQGGAGATFQIGSGHETKYYYGSADQKELDALFGTDAGDVSHYEKNMVRDANGQYSISYVDMHGRTVATALAGDTAASKLQRLLSYESVMQTDNLITPVNNIIKDNNIQSAKSILVPDSGNYIFNYTLSPESLSLNDCKDSTICYDCLYDLTITISDNCSNEQFGGNPIVIKKSNFSLFKEDSVTHNLDTTCLVANTITILDTFLLAEGSYDITKTLSISKAGMQYYRDSIFMVHNTCKSYNQLVLEMLDSIRQHLDCTPDSATTVLTTAYKEQMMADLTPLSGQYANNEEDPDCLSIFTIDGTGKYLYQSDKAGTYLDETGNPDILEWYNDEGELQRLSPKELSPQQFIQNFKDSWAEALLPLHPEYLLLVEYEKLKSAYSWEAEFFNTETYAEAVAKGFLNPTGSTNAPASQFTVSGKTDSLFIALGISDPGIVTSAKNDINAALFQYLDKGSGQYLNLWGISTGLAKCTDKNNETCFDHWNINANVFNTDSLCAGDLDMAWKIFRSQYLTIREDWIDNYTRLKSGVYPSTIGPNCHAVFPNRDISSVSADQQYGGYNGTSTDATTANDNLNKFLLDNCKAFATQWWQQLAPCGYTAADSTEIISRLVQVAYEGADAQHPFGASTVKPFSTHTDRSFEEVINEYNAIHYPSIDPVTCNAYLISDPKPYDQPGMIVNLPIIAAPDSCACNRITELYYKFVIDSTTYHSFSNYMLQTQGTSISQGTLDTLRNLCNTSSAQCKYLEKPILLPPALQCGMSDVCVSCVEVKTLKDSFAVKFPGITPTQEESDTIQQKKNELFANFMNHHLGFSKQAYEYLQFLETCPDTIAVCDSTYWTVYNPGTNLQINTDLYINSFNNIPPVSQFFSNGYFNAPSLVQAGHYVLVNKRDSLQVDTATLLMQWRIKPASVPDMINPFIRRGNTTTYVGAQWIQDPTDTTWWIGATILKGVDGTRIGGIGLQSNSHALQADWVKITHTGTGALLYFNNFSAAENCPGYASGPFLCGKQAADSSIILNMNPCADTMNSAIQGATYLFDIYRQKMKGQFEKAYMKKCLDAGKLESFTVTHPLSEYHYTLYYYDQAGNLVKTVPPEGVHPNRTTGWYEDVKEARNAGDHLPAPHTLTTTYRYNSLNQVISQHSPDGGLSRFWYDRLGRLVVSQNAKQAADGNYSYTLYDDLGRITEVGQKKQVTTMTDAIARQQSSLKTWLDYTYTSDGNTVIAEQVTSTVYDQKDELLGGMVYNLGYIINEHFQKAYTLRNRVSFTRFYDKLKWNALDGKVITEYDNSSTYSYDIHGNVDTLVHDYRSGMMVNHGMNRFKTMTYRYDLISGKVNEVHYQPGKADQLYHRYEYDAENRLTNAYTTDRKALMGIQGLEEHEAFYQYYKHGPLARTVLGELQVQGVDYAYTLQGWLKGVNSDSLLDGDGLSLTGVAKDAYRFSLNYFNGDYAAISASLAGVFPGHSSHLPGASDYRPLFNGNISSMVVGVPKLGDTRLYNYGYDQLNRIVKMDSYTGYDGAEMEWGTLNAHGGEYKERIAYDANGNILKYLRNGHAGQLNMDSLNYGYNRDGNGYLTNNKLRHVKDNVADGNYTEDIDNQTDDNYEYDAIGNLIKDTKEGIDNIEWTVYGKIKKITKSNGTMIGYTYDVAGNRISKAETTGEVTTTTWYTRDASGNVMAVYSGNNTALALNEQHIYGSSRLGIWNRSVDMDVAPNAISYIFTRGNKFFELSNHLGNVLATVSDKKIGVDPGADGTIDYYNADVVSANDYYPFGMMMVGRKWNGGNYRYGFNGQEKDDETYGEGNEYDFGARIYDPRLGRFLSVDPMRDKLSHLSPYGYAANSPLVLIDKDGEIPIIPLLLRGATGAVVSAAMQYSINMIIYQDSKKAFKEIDWGQVALDGLSSALPWNPPGGKWGKAAVAAAGVVSLKALRGTYNGHNGAEEVFSAVAVDFIVAYLTDVGAQTAANKLGKHAVPKIANWLATNGIAAKKIKSMTGLWTSRKNQFEADVANYLDGVKKGTVEDVGVMTNKLMPNGGTLKQEIDIVTKKFNVEVKGGKKLDEDQISQLMSKSKEDGKEAILFAPNIHEKTAASMEKKFPGLKVIRYFKDLSDKVTK